MHIDSLCCSCIASLSAPMFPGAAPLVCPRTFLSLKGQQLHLCRASSQSCYPGSSLSPLTLSDCFAGPGQIGPAFLCSFFTFISSVYSPNSTCPLLALFPFFALSLFLQTPHYTLSAFLILSPISHCLPPANLPFYCLSASPSAIC